MSKQKSNQSDKQETSSLSFAEKRAAAQKLLNKNISDKYGKNGIQQASEAAKMPRYSTGVLSLDMALGGGIGARCFTGVHGAESCFKTSIALKVIADAQKRSFLTNKYLFEPGLKGDQLIPNRCAIVDLEKAFDKDWAMTLGVNPDLLDIITSVTAEDAGDVLISLIESGLYGLILIDSLAQMVSEKEYESSMQDQHVGTTAKLNNSLFRKMQARFNKSASLGELENIPAVIIINQPRMKIGVMFGNPETLPGGEGQKFYYSTAIRFSGNKVSYFDKNGEYPKSAEFNFKTVKNKLYVPKIEGSFSFALADDPDGEYKKGDILEKKFVIEQAEFTKVIDKKDPNKWICFGEEFSTKGEMIKKWIDDPQKVLLVKQEILRRLYPKQ